MNISNIDFLKTIFKDEYLYAHVTDFTQDPTDIPQNERGKCWAGGHFKNYDFNLFIPANQFFTVSLFDYTQTDRSVRQKAFFKSCHLILLDDVKEKLQHEEALKLPKPTYIMETSKGSEQWGYVLTTPCTSRQHLDNLMDGLIQSGLTPDTKDPGMKGVTRYCRLPEGYNTKKSKMINGKPFKCRITEWNPAQTVTIEEVANTFDIDLHATRKTETVSGASNVPDHPLLKASLNIKKVLSKGRFDITCPWVAEHTSESDDGTAIFTNEDGTLGFKCHHGHCEHKTGRDLMRYIERIKPGFSEEYAKWRMLRIFSNITESNISDDNTDPVKDTLDKLRVEPLGTSQFNKLAETFLQTIDTLPEIEKYTYHTDLCSIAGWSQTVFNTIIKDMRTRWYEKKLNDSNFYDSIVFIKEQNMFYDYKTRIMYRPDAFQNSFSHEDAEAKKQALLNGKVTKVDKMDFAPLREKIFEKNDVVYANTWIEKNQIYGVEGDCSKWFDHFEKLGWSDNRDHILKWMAFTILHPDKKINHMLLFGGMEGTGKDFLLYPLIKAMGDYSYTIDGQELLEGYNDYLLSTKYLHINETELGDHKKSNEVSNKLKPLAAAPPDMFRINQKYVGHLKVTNIVNVTMTTNSQIPVRLNGATRRFYAVWTDVDIRDIEGQVSKEWLEYFDDLWKWMKEEGFLNCIWYLRNKVDISDFNPSETPVTTDFLKSIQESSKPPGQQTVEAFIVNKIGCFVYDIITCEDACATLKSELLGAEELRYIETKWFTPQKVGRILRDINGCVRLRAKKGDDDFRVWAVRNGQSYSGKGPAYIYETYMATK